MSKLKPGAFTDNKPVKVEVELPVTFNGDFVTYAELLSPSKGQPLTDQRG